MASNGRVSINTQQGEIQKVQDLDQNPLNDVQLVEAACNVTRGNQLVIPGRGGLPTVPSGLRSTVDTWEDTRFDSQFLSLTPETTAQPTAFQPEESRNGIVQAQGWVQNSQGQYQLVETTEQYSESLLATHHSGKGCPNSPS